MVKVKANPTKYYYVSMLLGNSTETIEAAVAKTYSEKRAIALAKKFMKKHGKTSQHNIAEVDVTMFKRLYKRTWHRKGLAGGTIAPEKRQVFALPKDVDCMPKKGVNCA
jgi:hypothetical protein